MLINKSEHERIGLNLLLQRRRRGWTQTELAKRSGISRARISDIERGKESFTLTSIIDLGNALGIDYKELLK
ncbi:helix-turn-helix domain-containing protein [Succiniclasticum sp.]|uniref:helix-turn-helix domain-containing protein n=1 Tax=Succiniclasticum sp. TaxID=2775030 RepID=UPI0034DABF72